ncbi:TonB-dependent receptor [Bowmanella dokdonensis]|uniref:TonB-dependent receptor n=1 Tax=Bowmanella dokdonensis TaxID=751969 RepID=A0A939DQ15_9ALTE|nr:TonB-dependent receptor [Bowmanella dokdonensis]MBN7826687.1 TonB-dependent receptor [Bowmanella dokdonensis]
MKFHKTRLTLACLSALLTGQAVADEGALQGRLTDKQQKAYFEGASVRIKELNLSTVTRRDGSFRFNTLPAGSYTLEIRYLGADKIVRQIQIKEGETLEQRIVLESEGQDLEYLIVYGQRAGQAGALNMQRTADNLKSVVSADAIGQFPDQNAAEALQRLPGLSIERDQGEGRFVGIRGIDPNLNNVTINGMNIPSPEAGVRSVALDVIPAELIEGLEVTKAVTPDMDADAIGGTVEVKSLSAFDRGGRSASLTVQASHNELRSKTSPKLSGSFTELLDMGDKEDVFGVALAVSWFDREFGSDNIESNGDDEIEQRYYGVARERIGAAVNLDYRPDFDNQYYLRTLYSRFSDDEYRQANTFVFDDEESEIERGTKDRYEVQEILSLSAGGEHQLDSWHMGYQLGYAQSSEDEPDALYYSFIGEGFDISSDFAGPIPTITQDTAAMDLANYEVDEVAFEDNLSEDEEISFKLDISRDIKLVGHSAQLKFGGKYRTREKTTDANIFIYDGDFDELSPGQFTASSPDWGLGNFGPGADRGGLRQHFNLNRSNLELAVLDSELESNGASYRSEEDIFAAYLMGKVDIDSLRIVAGYRYESTDFSTAGQRVELVEDEQNDVEEVINAPWTSEKDYSHLLPSLNLRYEFSEKLIGRFAYTQTIARPKFEDSAAFQIIESSTEENDDGEFETEREAEVGNPELEPFESDNIDVAIEYYPGSIGVLSAGYFHKSIDNFVILADVSELDAWKGFDEVIQPINGERAKVQGVELSWVKSFDNGLLIAANATLSDSEAVTFLDGERFETSLPNQSDKVGNLTLGYEDHAWSLRLTLSHKSENLEEIDGDMLRMEDSHQQLDFSGKYYINQQMHLYFNAINLNDEPYYHYFDSRTVNAQYEEYGRTFELGFSWTL